jgi:single-stranded DNA-binding protein
MDFQKTIFQGKLVKPPILNKIDGGKKVTNGQVKITRFYKDKEYSTVLNIEAWGDMAMRLSDAPVGASVYGVGSISNSSYTDKNGEKKWVTKVRLSELETDAPQSSQHQQETQDDGDLPF